MSDEPIIPLPRPRSAYEAYISEGDNDTYLSILAETQDRRDLATKVTEYSWEPGDIFRTIVRQLGNKGAPSRIPTLKLGKGEYCFAGTDEELQALAMLHGVYKEG